MCVLTLLQPCHEILDAFLFKFRVPLQTSVADTSVVHRRREHVETPLPILVESPARRVPTKDAVEQGGGANRATHEPPCYLVGAKVGVGDPDDPGRSGNRGRGKGGWCNVS